MYDRLAELIREHRTTLIFVNTRRLAERVARHLAERLGEEHVTAHHGSLAREHRLEAEQRLKTGELQGAGGHRLARTRHRHRRHRPGVPARLAARASQRLLQRVGPRRPRASARSRRGGCSRWRSTTWWNARRCSMRCGAASWTASACPAQPLDVLAQQIVAEVACREWDEATSCTTLSAAPGLTASSTARSSSGGADARRRLHTRRGRRGAYLHYDAVQRRAARAPRRAARRHHQRRRDPRPVRLRRGAAAGGAPRRHAERGLRLREPAGRHLPARQHLLPHR